MSFRSDFYEYLKADVGLSALVSEKIYPFFVADNTVARPYLTYVFLYNAPYYHMDSIGSVNESMVDRANIQFDIWGDTSKQAIDVEAALRAALSGFSGLMNGGTNVRRFMKQNELDNIEPPSDGSNEPEYRIIVDYQVWYNNT